MGILIGGSAGGTSIGIAPGSQWIAVKIFNTANEATLSGIHKGFQWLLDPDNNTETDDAPDVINNSWGLANTVNTCNDEFQEDIQALKNAGIALAFSAGNGGPFPSTSESPANYPESFSVGALEDNSTIMVPSSRGPSACDLSIYPEVVAPGVNIRTADLTFGGVLPDSYINVTGTSFAAAHVSGAMAVLLSAFPCATILELESALKDSAIDLGTPGPDHDFGYGRIDMIAAYNVLTSAGIPATCPDNDEDNDGVGDLYDNCPAIQNPQQLDADNDGTGDLCDDTPGCGNCGQPACEVSSDIDNDGILNTEDNCPDQANPSQEDADNDTIGDVCDPCRDDPDNDIDGDGFCGDVDTCPNDPNNDEDSDGVCGDVDNCPDLANPGQEDIDDDSVGDVCDNCKFLCNSGQLDGDNDGIGDACDPEPGCGGCGAPQCEVEC
jgi:hypothetical protein